MGVTLNINRLKSLAEDVVDWSCNNSAWLDSSEDDSVAVVGHISEEGITYPVAVIDCDQYYQGQDSLKLAKFYAEASPAVVLALIEKIEELQEAGNRDAH